MPGRESSRDSLPEDATQDLRLAQAREAPGLIDRYVQERQLGEGAMGAVYLVRDRETGEQLALKKLFYVDPRSVLRLKREFRSVADMNHPNLVKVYELGHSEAGLFLAMEYVPGVDLNAHLGIDNAREHAAHSHLDAAIAHFASQRAWLEQQLLPLFYQLASGVQALHRSGILHRDLKPSNVLVAGQRVVVLDFGLVRELDPNAAPLTENGALTGTPAYMAPEQALGKPLSEASDWYAFGVMFYEALTAKLPFDGTLMEVLRGKLERDPARPETLNPEIPASLSELCMALLARDPALRPSGSDVLQRLGPSRPANTQTEPVTAEAALFTEQQSATSAPFFGRSQELHALSQALALSSAGRSTVVHVRGVSGTGKSALVEHFLEHVAQQSPPSERDAVLVLRSRCYEREAMPFKALDGVVDALTRHLSALADYEVSHLLPRDVAALSRLFPVFERLRAVQRLLTMNAQLGDAVHNRQRGEAALRELLTRLSSARPVLIWIDDLQWGDLDSAGILKGVLQLSTRLPLLLLLSYRSDEVDTSECLRLLLSMSAGDGPSSACVLQVAALGPDDMAALCRGQLGTYARQQPTLVEHIVNEADGSPFLAARLTALALAKLTRGAGDLAGISLAELVAQTDSLLPPDARQFLRVLSLAGRPIAPGLALRAAGLQRGAREIVHALRGQLLVRTRDVAGERLIEVYHDRVRESVQRSLSPAQTEELHASLLATLEYSGRADPDWLYAHAVGAKQRAAALHHGLLAAQRAMTTLAFEHAVELYAHCVELSEACGAERGELLRKLADALVFAGRGGKAANAYREAAQLSPGPEALPLLRLAASHLLRSGRFEEGDALAQRVVAAFGLRVPKTRLSLRAAMLWERVRLFVRGRRFNVRKADQIPAALLNRIDACSALAREFHAIHPLRAAWFMLQSLRWALDAGEPQRLLAALGALSHLVFTRTHRRQQQRGDQLIAQMKRLADALGTNAAKIVLMGAQVHASWTRANAEAALAPSYEVERLCREDTTDRIGNYHTRFSIVSARIGALWQLADYRRFASELTAALDEARATENIAAELSLALSETLLEHLQDRSEHSSARLVRQHGLLPRGEFGLYHALQMISVCYAAYATGRHAWGLEVLERDWPRYLQSDFARGGVMALAAQVYCGALRLNEYVAGGSTDAKTLRDIDRETTRLARALRDVKHFRFKLFEARIAWLKHDEARALAALQHALDTSSDANAEMARYALGHITGGASGTEMCTQAERKLQELGIVNPAHYLATAYPEFAQRR